jgi:hypothetical protein
MISYQLFIPYTLYLAQREDFNLPRCDPLDYVDYLRRLNCNMCHISRTWYNPSSGNVLDLRIEAVRLLLGLAGSYVASAGMTRKLYVVWPIHPKTAA